MNQATEIKDEIEEYRQISNRISSSIKNNNKQTLFHGV